MAKNGGRCTKHQDLCYGKGHTDTASGTTVLVKHKPFVHKIGQDCVACSRIIWGVSKRPDEPVKEQKERPKKEKKQHQPLGKKRRKESRPKEDKKPREGDKNKKTGKTGRKTGKNGKKTVKHN